MFDFNKKQKHNKIVNKKAHYNFYIEKTIEAGLILHSWEVKSIRLKKVNITNGYLIFRNQEIYLIGMNIQPFLKSHLTNDIQKNRSIKVLLKKKEIHFLYGKFKTKQYSLIARSLYWKRAWCKLEIAIAKGKNIKDKKINIQEKEWIINKNRIFKNLLK